MTPTQIFELRLRDTSGNNGNEIEAILRLPLAKVTRINKQLAKANNPYYWKQFKK